MFEALFILTTIDSGTRVGRFLIQEFMGRVYAPFARPQLAARRAASRRRSWSLSWGYFIYTGQIDTIWPMFGVGQPAARLRGAGRGHHHPDQPGQGYIWVTLVPLVFLGINTLYGGYLNIPDNYWPRTLAPYRRSSRKAGS